MDYETVSIQKTYKPHTCWIESDKNLGWHKGELTEFGISLCGDFIVGDTALVSVPDFFSGSKTKYFEMVLTDSYDTIVNTQVMEASEFEYYEDRVTAFFIVDEELSNELKVGTYHLYVYAKNTLPPVKDLEERTILNVLLTDPEGLEITIT